MAKVPPEGSSTVVEARRTAKAGTVSALAPDPIWYEPALVSCDTSVEICSEIIPEDRTTGVKLRPTPNCL